MNKRKRIKVGPVLIIASLGLLGIGYCPAPSIKPKPSREFITKTYYRPTGAERSRASELRKQEILKEIRRIRTQIRIQADKNNLREKNAIHYGRDNEISYKLLMDIINSKT